MTVTELSTLKQAARATWAAGHYATIGDLIWAVGGRVVRSVGVRPDDEVLDVACGTGNAAIPAAQAGASVVGVDLTPELFGEARVRAADAGVEVDWIEGDAEALPFDDASFDVVLSTFGVMFAPRHETTAHETARVLRPGGRMGLCNWTPEGATGDLFTTVARHAPPPPEVAAAPPLAWGREDHVLALFEATGIECEFRRELVDFRFGSVEDGVHTYETCFGPIVKARQRLEKEGRWAALRDDLTALFTRHNVATDGTLTYRAEYLLALGRKEG
jgi:SAM-dependent methyltransferase